MERARRCGYLGLAEGNAGPPVWIRRNIVLQSCPVSYVRSESEAYLEQYLVWRRFGGVDVRELPARTVEAFLIIDGELEKEREYAGA
jgi:hypothetical protein